MLQDSFEAPVVKTEAIKNSASTFWRCFTEMTYKPSPDRTEWLKSQDAPETITINFQGHNSKRECEESFLLCTETVPACVNTRCLNHCYSPKFTANFKKLEKQTKIELLQCKECKRNTNYNVDINSAAYKFMWIILSATATET